MKKSMTFLSVLLLSAFTTFAGEYPEISHDELVKAIDQKSVTIIDVNGTKSYEKGHIPGAINFEGGKIASALPKDKDALIVSYCGNEQCQAYREGAKAAVDLGYKNVKHYAGGIAGWKKSGASVESGKM